VFPNNTDRSLRYSDYDVVTYTNTRRLIPEFIRGIKWRVATDRARSRNESKRTNGEERKERLFQKTDILRRCLNT